MNIHNKAFLITLLFLPLLLLPIIFLLYESVYDKSGRWSFDILLSIIMSSRQLGLLKNSVLLAGGTAIFSLLIGIPFAFFISRTDLPFRRLFSSVYLVPFLIPPYMQAIIWTKMLAPDYLINPGPVQLTMPTIFSIPGGIFISTLSMLPLVILIVSSGINTVDHTLEEVSLLKKGIVTTIGKITLPMVAPHIAFSGLLVFIFTLINFEVADILRIKVYPMEIFINFSAYYDEKQATILSIPLMLLAMGLLTSITIFFKGKSYIVLHWTSPEKALIKLGIYRTPAMLFAAFIIILSVIIPLFVLILGAGNPGIYLQVLQLSKEVIWYSLWTSLTSSVIMVFFCFFTAYCIVRTSGSTRYFIDYFTLIPLGVPSVVLVIGLIKVWNQPYIDWVYGSSLILIIGYIAGYSALIIRIIAPFIEQISQDLEYAASLSNKNWISILQTIIIPLALPGITTGFIIGFIVCIGNLGTSLLVVSPGKSTVPIAIYNYMHYGSEKMVFALCLVLIFFIILALLILLFTFKKMHKKVFQC